MSVSEIWTVRGISDDIQKRVSDAARAAGMRLGPFVERILLDALERPEGQGTPSGQEGAGDLAERVAALAARVERLEAVQAAPAIPSRQGSALDAVEPVGGAEVLKTPEALPGASGRLVEGRRSRRPWTDADDAELRRIAERGGTQADAARELGRSDGVINEKWKALGLPVPPRKGRKLKQ